eukprot:5892497-Pleurochrysis_carterae.AAC.1
MDECDICVVPPAPCWLASYPSAFFCAVKWSFLPIFLAYRMSEMIATTETSLATRIILRSRRDPDPYIERDTMVPCNASPIASH